MQNYSLLRGPCPYGFHVPLTTERQGVKAIMDYFSLTTGDSWRTNLHMPFAGYRSTVDSSIFYQYGYYWSSSPYNAASDTDYDSVRIVSLSSSGVIAQDVNRRSNGLSLRCFKDSYEIPDSTWTVVQGTLGSAGIFWNQSEGLISITNGTTGYTMMDKNLGATTVFNQGDTVSDANSGYFYQWGNNYGFPHSGTVTTSATQVDASGYGPYNYYSSSTFITRTTNPYNWSFVGNNDLRGYESFMSGDNVVEGNHDYSVLRGPCSEGFHVPLAKEIILLFNILRSFGRDSAGHGSDRIKQRLHMPFAGERGYDGIVNRGGTVGLYRTVSPVHGGSYRKSTTLRLVENSTWYLYDYNRSDGYTIRPFKDVYVAPDSSRTVIYGTLSAGVLWDQTNGIISITDGTNGLTIADKNLGASQVYNDGDTMTEANCGKYYQWGNNYGFPFDGTVRVQRTDVNRTPGYGPGNYYYSNIFIANTEDRSHPQNDNLWGYETFMNQDNDIFIGEGPYAHDLQGPCPNGFHVPHMSEWQGLYDLLNEHVDANSPTYWKQYLHLPTQTGSINNYNGNYYTGDSADYWSADPYSNDDPRANALYILDSGSGGYVYRPGTNGRRASGYSIRPFRDCFIKQTTGRTTIVQRGATPSGAGIYWNQTEGIITITDGHGGYTISDKNLGATQVRSVGDTNSESNCGKFYQRGNNYGFPFSGTITKSSTKVDASNYGPGNYYSSSTFITSPGDWSSVLNNNLRGGAEGKVGTYDHLEIYVGDCRDITLLRGPCPQGWHIPNGQETDVLEDLTQEAHEYLYGHRTGYLQLDNSGTLVQTNYRVGFVWTSTGQEGGTAWSTNMGTSSTTGTSEYKKTCLPIRPFKDEYVEPDSSWEFIDVSDKGGYRTCFIYRKSGYISIELYVSGEGWRKITLADKNLGAENLGDAGYYYQWGNNHGRSPGDQPTVSTTRVDTTGYGPGNRYDNNVYYRINTYGVYSRSDPDNNNLRGITSWVNSLSSSNVFEVYKGNTLVWTNYKPLTPEVGVYRCAAKGLISMTSDLTTWITIADRNLGATRPLSTGLFYQRGNNYGFTRNPTSISSAWDASGYGPGNYFFGTLFRRMSSDRSESWDSSNNNNLWGGEVGTNEATQGPCREGWHIPSSAEWTSVKNVINTLGKINEFFDILLINEQRGLNPTGSQSAPTVNLWMNQNFSNSHGQVLGKYNNGLPQTSGVGVVKSAGMQIRPFRNEPVIPDDTSRVKVA